MKGKGECETISKKQVTVVSQCEGHVINARSDDNGERKTMK
jgi:hypothetical protein